MRTPDGQPATPGPSCSADGLELLADEAEMTVGTRIGHLKGNVRLVFPNEPVAK
jgi:hypothetical protein